MIAAVPSGDVPARASSHWKVLIEGEAQSLCDDYWPVALIGQSL
jgi:hypothetical protein